MIKLKSLAASLALALLSVVPAHAQGIGQLGPGQVWGNTSASQGRGAPTNVSPLLDKAFGSTRGAILERGASGWVLLPPGTSGLPLTSAGAGADPAYSAVGANALPTPTASTLGGVMSLTCSTHTWFSSLATSGVFGCTQPNFSDLAGSIASGQIPNATVSYAQIQNVAASRLLGNPTGSPAAPSEITLDPTLGFSGTAVKCTTATNSQNGCVHPDNVTITVDGTGKIVAIGAASTAIDAAGATTITNAAPSGCVLYDNAGKVGCSGNPTNLYASPAGSGNCLTSGTACSFTTAAALAQGILNLGGSAVTINLATGTYTSAVSFSGAISGSTNSTASAPQVKILGVAGTILDTSTNCAGGATPLTVTNGAVVGIGTVKIQTTCSGGNGLLVLNGGTAYLLDGNVNFGAVNSAQIFVLYAKFDANYGGPFGMTFSGSATYAFEGSTHAVIVTGVGVTNTLTGTPAYSGAFLSLLDASFYNEGINSTWSGSATGNRYAIALNSHMDREQSTQKLPGSVDGTVQGVSIYYANGLNGGVSIDTPCIGAVAGCRNTTASTGLGTGGTIVLLSGSGDHSGSIGLVIGTGGTSGGTAEIAPVSKLTGDYGGRGFCTVGMNNNGGQWPANGQVQGYLDTNGLHVLFSGTLSAGITYYVGYVCS